jgi:hypothetical protein
MGLNRPLDTMSDELKIAIEAAKKAAEYALKFYGKRLDISNKNDGTVFTTVEKST